MEYRMLKTEGFLRLLSVVFTALTACVIGLDTQTKVVFVEKKATVKDLSSLWVLTIAASVAGAYQLLQFCKCLLIGLSGEGNCRCSKGLSWVCLLLDQGFTYGMVCTTAAATQASLLAITGANSLQWRKVCSIFTRFCEQVGGGSPALSPLHWPCLCWPPSPATASSETTTP
ncbi:unnamed protein product [Spirodela intermedia]|uniref:CASP-like protein n=1 Tax=Spirodela intermedia TaxID=51605 RepID=A0A7I8JNA3_SPIIN|nr:unnamed protein product [Spirodela intermedia]CAA6671063.1 unnamed protein product [Spirodela intermedia]